MKRIYDNNGKMIGYELDPEREYTAGHDELYNSGTGMSFMEHVTKLKEERGSVRTILYLILWIGYPIATVLLPLIVFLIGEGKYFLEALGLLVGMGLGFFYRSFLMDFLIWQNSQNKWTVLLVLQMAFFVHLLLKSNLKVI